MRLGRRNSLPVVQCKLETGLKTGRGGGYISCVRGEEEVLTTCLGVMSVCAWFSNFAETLWF